MAQVDPQALANVNNIMNDSRWRILRDTGGGWAGTAVDDADFTDPAQLAAFEALGVQSVPNRTPDGEEAKVIVFYAVGYSAAGAVLARASSAFEIYVYEHIRNHDVRNGQVESLPAVVIDSAPISTNVTLNRKITINAKGIERFQIGIQSYATMPAGIDRVRVFWRME